MFSLFLSWNWVRERERKSLIFLGLVFGSPNFTRTEPRVNIPTYIITEEHAEQCEVFIDLTPEVMR